MAAAQHFSEAPTRAGRPRKGQPHPATLVVLSPSTDVVLSRRGAMFVRGQQAFTLSDRELVTLAVVLAKDEES